MRAASLIATSTVGPVIVGRDPQVTELTAVLDDAREGRSRSALLVGDAGMGKSTLLTATERIARRRGFQLVRTASPEGSVRMRYAVIEDLLGALPEALGRVDPGDAQLLVGLTRSGSVGPGRVASALLRLFATIQDGEPLLVLIDDLHWADSASIAALTLTAGRLQSRPVAMVGATRPQTTMDPRLARWQRIDVGVLDEPAALQVLSASLAPDISAVLVGTQAEQVVRVLGCHPLAIRECSRLLTEDQIRGSAHIPDPIPLTERLLSAWGGAFCALPLPSQAAVLGLCVTRGAGSGLLDWVLADCGVSRADLTPAVEAGLVQFIPGSAGRARPDVTHTLIASAVLTAAGDGPTRAMHGRAARGARALNLAPAVVVNHLFAGSDPGDPAAVHALEAEAQRALDNDQAGTAARALQAAAELSISGEHRWRLAARAAQTLLTVSPYVVEVEVLLDLLASADLTPQESIWADWLRAEYTAEQDMRASLAFLVMAADRAREVGSEALPQILWSAAYTAWAVGDRQTALELAGAFVDWETLADPQATGVLPPWAGRTLLGLTRFQLGDVAGAEEELAVAREMAEDWEMSADVDIGLLVNVVVFDQALGLHRSSSDPRLHTAVRRLEGDSAETMSFLRNIQAARALRVGETALARSLVDEGLDLSRAVQSSPNIILRLCTAVRIDAMTGGSEVMALHRDELRMLSRRLGHASGLAYANRAEGLLALAEGRLDDALGALEPLTADLLLGIGPADPVPSGRVDLIEALVRTGDLARATELAGQVRQVLAPSGHPIAAGLRHRAAALVAQGESAGAEFTRAREAFEEAGDVFQVARTRLLHGEMLRRERRPAEARDELRAAAAAFERIGALPWQERALGELRATGSAVPAGVGTAWESLTAQERQVARAVAQGGSNREVAAALFLSPRTVEHHLSSAFRKLGVRSRTALAHSLTSQARDAQESPDDAGPPDPETAWAEPSPVR